MTGHHPHGWQRIIVIDKNLGLEKSGGSGKRKQVYIECGDAKTGCSHRYVFSVKVEKQSFEGGRLEYRLQAESLANGKFR
jgi:hypothetical protein